MKLLPIMRAALLLFGLLPIMLAPIEQASGQQAVRIAAVVNNEAISVPDLVARIDIAIVSSQLQIGEELRQQLAPQVLRSLIDERLKVQEAERHRLRVSRAELANARQTVEQRNGIPAGALDEFLRRPGTGRCVRHGATARRDSLVQARPWPPGCDGFGRRGRDRRGHCPARGQPGSSRYRVAEIFLAVDSIGREAEVRGAAASLYRQLSAGASFAQIAQQFSQSATAAVGGDIGWVVEGQLPARSRPCLRT